MSLSIGQQALTRDLLDEQATDLLRSTTLMGEITPGSKLGEREVARVLAVSRAPVGDALLRIEGEGLVTSRRDGPYVIELDQEYLTQVFAVRGVVDC